MTHVARGLYLMSACIFATACVKGACSCLVLIFASVGQILQLFCEPMSCAVPRLAARFVQASASKTGTADLG